MIKINKRDIKIEFTINSSLHFFVIFNFCCLKKQIMLKIQFFPKDDQPNLLF